MSQNLTNPLPQPEKNDVSINVSSASPDSPARVLAGELAALFGGNGLSQNEQIVLVTKRIELWHAEQNLRTEILKGLVR